VSFAEFVFATVLAFLAGGAGLALVAYLSRELVGHWLAKNLKKYGADVDTTEQRKRFAFEALHGRRATTVEEISTLVADAMHLYTHPPALDGVHLDPKDSVELRYFAHWKAIRLKGDEVVRTAVAAMAFFESQELAQAAMAWSSQLIAAVDPLHDSVTQATAEPGHWDQSREGRIARMEAARLQVVTPFRQGLSDATQALIAQLRAIMHG
jgi:hypothetical protein